MLALRIVTFSADDENQTVACTGDQPSTTFIANEFWWSISATNGKELTPSDLDGVASFQPFGRPVETGVKDFSALPNHGQ